eukprot:24504-Eustigmatos_ZCMA.PRE.1
MGSYALRSTFLVLVWVWVKAADGSWFVFSAKPAEGRLRSMVLMWVLAERGKGSYALPSMLVALVLLKPAEGLEVNVEAAAVA